MLYAAVLRRLYISNSWQTRNRETSVRPLDAVVKPRVLAGWKATFIWHHEGSTLRSSSQYLSCAARK